ncbi:MAG: YkgJ family cysteine cluster protein [Desulfobulbaceae bacterium]|nr:YkgJ family cysteine cluster protein [Desulfobulbaceae bacterium]
MMNVTDQKKQFPDGMKPLGNASFRFACHDGLSCYTQCCRRQNIFLYPYDIIRLKERLGISSEDFLNKHTGAVKGPNPFFPSIMLQMAENEEQTCPFLGDNGCTVYEDRPSACRTYPLERAVDRNPAKGEPREYYFLTDHPYCKGHGEDKEWTVKEWLRDQQLLQYNLMDELWAEMDTIFAGNPWHGEGAAGPRQQVAFMVCYNIDRFRQYVADFKLLDQFKIDKQRRRSIDGDDEALLRFGYDWLKLILANIPALKQRRQA